MALVGVVSGPFAWGYSQNAERGHDEAARPDRAASNLPAEFVRGIESGTTGSRDGNKTMKLGVYSNPLWQSMQHLVNHGTYHRGQVTTMLRQLDAKPILTDLMHFYREQAAAAGA